MLISCKVSNSILVDLERQGRDLSTVLQSCDVPEEFLRDPSCWLEAPRMETFLSEIDQTFLDLPETFLRDIGRRCESLRSWGVLDSVLKMMESPLDIYNQPNRFLSYFISPEPPVMGWKHEGEKVEFHLPVSPGQYPRITQYLMGALEGLPAYMRQALSHVEWQESCLQIFWSQNQENLLPAEDLEVRQFNPEWVRTVMEDLEQQQKHWERRQSPRPVEEASPEVKNLMAKSLRQAELTAEDIFTLKEDFLKLHDYFARSQQLITFLIHSGRKTKQVDEAMRRMDWNHVQSSYNAMVEKACERILTAKDRTQNYIKELKETDLKSTAETGVSVPSEPPHESLSWSASIERL